MGVTNKHVNSGHALDQDLIHLSVQGDSGAFASLYERYVDEIYNYVYHRIKAKREAEDITETVFLKSFKNLPDYLDDYSSESFKAWIFRVARVQVDRYFQNSGSPGIISKQDPILKFVYNPDADVKKARADLIQFALQYVRPIDHEVIVFRFMCGLNQRETAYVMKMTRSHVRTLEYQALNRIRRIMLKLKQK